MEIQRFIPEQDVLKDTAPSFVSRIFENEERESLFLGGYEGAGLVCYAMFSRFLSDKQPELYLKYIYTLPQFRRQGKCFQLLEGCRAYLKKSGINSVLVKHFIVPEQAEEYNQFLCKRDFIPLNLTSRLLYYPLRDLDRPGTLQAVTDNMDRLPPALSMEEAGEKRVFEFLKKHGRDQVSIRESSGPFSRFFVDDGRVEGAVLASVHCESTLYVSSIIMSDDAKKKNVFLVLFAVCIDMAREYPGTITDVLIQVDDESVYQGLLSVFIPPEEMYLVMEHVLLTEV